MAATNHSILLGIMARLYPPLPRVADNQLPEAGQTVVYRLRGKAYTAQVLGVGIGDFDEPEFYLDTKVKVLRYSITGVMSERVAA